MATMAVHTYLQSIEKARRGRRERKAAASSDGGDDGGLRRERGDEERTNGPGETTECGPAGLAAEDRGSRGHLPPPYCLGSHLD